MADIYKFKIKLEHLEDRLWRDIEVTSVSSLAKLAYAVLAAYEATASHLFNLRYKGKTYEIEFNDWSNDEPAIDPRATKLSSLGLSAGDMMKMEYDYGAGWVFSIQLISISAMKPGTGTHYPYITDGQGKGIIEDTSPFELIEMIERIDTTGKLPKLYDYTWDRETEWDYRKFDLKYTNAFYKDHLARIRDAYEQME